MELAIFRRRLRAGATLLGLFFVTRGAVKPAGPALSEDGTELRYHDRRRTSYYSIFGKLAVWRHAFTAPGRPVVCPLDAALVAALLALLAVEGQQAAAASTMPGPSKLAEQWTTMASRTLTPFVPAATVSANGIAAQAGAVIPATRPDLSVSFAHLDEAQAGQRFTYTVQLRNDGGPASTAVVSTVLPPQLSNVRVTAPGFACTRHFAASGPQAGTLVSCTRNDFESGGAADVVVEANAPSTAGPIQLAATADPRDDVVELDEANNEANATLEVRG